MVIILVGCKRCEQKLSIFEESSSEVENSAFFLQDLNIVSIIVSVMYMVRII